MEIHPPGLAFIAAARFVSSALRNSRVRFRRRILRQRSRPNLALSPFLSDTDFSLASLGTQIETAVDPASSDFGIQGAMDGVGSALSSDTPSESMMAMPGVFLIQEAASARSS